MEQPFLFFRFNLLKICLCIFVPLSIFAIDNPSLIEELITTYHFKEAKEQISNPNTKIKINRCNASIFRPLFTSIYQTPKITNEQPILDFIAFLLDKGANVNQKFSIRKEGDINRSILEEAFFYQGPHQHLFEQITIKLLQHNAIITPRMIRTFKLDIKATKKSPYLSFFLQQKAVTEEELLASVKKKKEKNYEKELKKASKCLEKELKIHHLNCSLISIDKINDLRSLKKEIKQVLRVDKNAKLLKEYRDFVLLYDRLIDNHFLLRELREISREIRSNNPSSYRLNKFYAMWGPEDNFGKTSFAFKYIFTKEKRPVYWEFLRNRVLNAFKTTQKDSFLQQREIVWLHGTKSSSLVPIMKEKKILPAATLIKDKIAPFSGELKGSDRSINKIKISGEVFSYDWRDMRRNYFDTATKGLIAFLYASKNDGYEPNEKQFNLKRSYARLSIANIQKLLDEPYTHKHWGLVKIDVLRLKEFDKRVNKRLQPLKTFLKTVQTKDKDKALEIEELNKLLQGEAKYRFTKQERKLITMGFPIVLASTSLYSIPYTNTVVEAEFLVKHAALLGQDIDVVFTSKDKKDMLQKLLKPFAIKVYDFETMFYLETANMIRGTRYFNRPHNKRIAITLQEDVLPLYAVPFNKKPRAFYHGKYLSLREYKNQVTMGKIVARKVHGPLHAARCVIWTKILKDFFFKNLSSDDEFLLAMTAAMHDVAREDEGKDIWEKASALKLKEYLINIGFNREERIAPYVDAIVHKDDKNTPSNIVKLLHDVDCLEIMRVLKDFKDFQKERLYFYTDRDSKSGRRAKSCASDFKKSKQPLFEGNRGDAELLKNVDAWEGAGPLFESRSVYHLDKLSMREKDGLIEEIRRFIEMSDNLLFMLHLEQESPNIYEELLKLIKDNNFPLLQHYL
jgi:hypothetical protein